ALLVAQLELLPETVLEGFRIAHRHGVRTLLNPGPFRPPGVELLGLTDILTPNESEARRLVGLAPADPMPHGDVARRLRGLGAGTVVMTLGGDGALVVAAGGVTVVPPFQVEVADVTGAGDCFTAALAVELAAGRPLREAARFASAAGALAVT